MGQNPIPPALPPGSLLLRELHVRRRRRRGDVAIRMSPQASGSSSGGIAVMMWSISAPRVKTIAPHAPAGSPQTAAATSPGPSASSRPSRAAQTKCGSVGSRIGRADDGILVTTTHSCGRSKKLESSSAKSVSNIADAPRPPSKPMPMLMPHVAAANAHAKFTQVDVPAHVRRLERVEPIRGLLGVRLALSLQYGGGRWGRDEGDGQRIRECNRWMRDLFMEIKDRMSMALPALAVGWGPR
ncbi:hypothetical protein C8R46DRAFT_1206103 [Mycena filopes]|nr:hypothetical protein C8R46DRAFT_1206103 [Mycena filopes]